MLKRLAMFGNLNKFVVCCFLANSGFEKPNKQAGIDIELNTLSLRDYGSLK